MNVVKANSWHTFSVNYNDTNNTQKNIFNQMAVNLRQTHLRKHVRGRGDLVWLLIG